MGKKSKKKAIDRGLILMIYDHSPFLDYFRRIYSPFLDYFRRLCIFHVRTVLNKTKIEDCLRKNFKIAVMSDKYVDIFNICHKHLLIQPDLHTVVSRRKLSTVRREPET
jgi:hypothetical protein